REDVELLHPRIALENLLEQLHVDREPVGMLAQRRIEQEDGVRGERLRMFDLLQLGPDAGINIERAAFALSATDRLHLRLRGRECEHDITAGGFLLPATAVVEAAAAFLFLRVLWKKNRLSAVGGACLEREVKLR